MIGYRLIYICPALCTLNYTLITKIVICVPSTEYNWGLSCCDRMCNIYHMQSVPVTYGECYFYYKHQLQTSKEGQL